MKVIIAGGRDFVGKPRDMALLKRLAKKHGITEVVSGCAAGADTFGEMFAREAGLPVKRFPADWHAYGRAAGHLRNESMASYADAVILFPGGYGTADMRRRAARHNLPILYDPQGKKESKP